MTAEPDLPRATRRGVGPFSLRQVSLVGAAVILTAIGVTLATAPLGTTGPTLPVPGATAYLVGSPVPGLRIGDLAPELTVPDGAGGTFTLTDLDGRAISLADLRGRVVWIDFWASWCPPCQSETPTIRAMDERYRDRGLTIVAVQVQQPVEEGRRYAERYGLEYSIGADTAGHVFRAYRVFALPTQFFIDADGVIRAIINGPLDEEGASRLIEGLLPTGPDASGATSVVNP